MIEPIKEKLDRIKALDAGKPRKKIAILGAGMAGLTAAFELLNLGHQVVIYEANSRIGGRAWTHRFEDGQYHEFGAMRFPNLHDHTRHYANLCGLKFRTFVNHHDDKDTFYYIKGKLSKHSEWKEKLLPHFELSEEDKKKILENDSSQEDNTHRKLLNLLNIPIKELVEKIKKDPADVNALLAEGPMTDTIRELDKISLGTFLRQHLSEEALDLIGAVTGLEVWWDRAISMFVRDEIVAEKRKQITNIKASAIDEIVGGTDQLPFALHRKVINMGAKYNDRHMVRGIERKSDGQIRIEIENEHHQKVLDFDYVICTLPFSILRQIKLSGLSKGKRRAIRNLTYASSAKVLLNTKERFWENDNDIIGGGSQTDLIIRQIYYPSDNLQAEKGPTDPSALKNVHGLSNNLKNKALKDPSKSRQSGVLVGSYCWGQDARRLGALDKEERGKVVIETASQIHPELLKDGMVKCEPASIFWDEYKYTAGAFCFMKPGDFTNYYTDSIKPEGNLFFAGEHCSLDQGWIQGSIISSLRTVEQLVQSKISQSSKAEVSS